MSLRPGLGATYRLQLRADFGFAAAAALTPYLERLGVETLYLSPVAEAVPGSAHGYDGTDPTRIRSELGGEDGYDALVSACERHGLGICVDHVPNHLSTWPGGPWWRRLLAGGRASPMAEVFDVDWEAGEGRVVLPLLDEPIGTAVADGTVRLGTRGGEPVVLVGDLDLPVAPGTARTGVAATLDAQHYRLATWRDLAGRNYRRFFDIDGLVGIRLEDPAVFERTQALVIGLARSGRLSALRIDHVDGLQRPGAYLRRLAAETGVPIVVEKILTGDERLRADWGVVGSTGYEAIDDLGGILVDPHGLDRLVAAGHADGDPDVEALTVETRQLVADRSFAGELARLAVPLGADPADLRAVTTRLPRYRTYLDSTEGDAVEVEGAGSALRHELEETAVWRALRTPEGVRPDADVVDALLEPAHRECTLRIQQLTGALMAKGVEDTAWYRLAGPLAFCEVGGDAARRRHDALERWHERAAARTARGIHGLVPGSTHDTKRSQDVRCRLYALSEMAVPFEEGLRRLRETAGLGDGRDGLAFETRVAAQLALAVLPPLDDAAPGAPGPVPEGTGWPGDAGWSGRDTARRLGDALVKGAREAKRRSSWTSPDEVYEAQLRELAERLLAGRGQVLREAFGPVLDEVVRLGALNSLTSVVLRHAYPGVPDCYQGDEVWNLSLVDPDNRRPVDFAQLSRCLERVEGSGPEDVAALRRSWRDGRVKLHVTATCLHAGRTGGRAAPSSALAPDADYLRLAAWGPAAGSLLAFARRSASAPHHEGWAVAVVTRLGARLEADGDDLPVGPSYEGTVVSLPDAAPPVLTDACTGNEIVVHDDGTLDVSEVLSSLPVALLVGGHPD